MLAKRGPKTPLEEGKALPLPSLVYMSETWVVIRGVKEAGERLVGGALQSHNKALL